MKPIGGYTAADRAPILRFKCPACGAVPRSQCTAASGAECMPHKARVVRSLAAKAASRFPVQPDAVAVSAAQL